MRVSSVRSVAAGVGMAPAPWPVCPGVKLRMRSDPRNHATQSNSHRRDDYCVIFLHIPKTAGTTLASSLQWNYPPHATRHVDLFGKPEKIQEFSREDLSQVRLLHGHIAYGIHEYLPVPTRYVTVVREPVARVVSAYKFILNLERHGLHEQVVKDQIGLEEFIETFWVDKRISRQTRLLCDRHDGPLDDDALEEAKHNLTGFWVVGLTERFEETFALLRRKLRLRLPFYATRNVGRPIPVSDRAVELIRGRERYDLGLYEFASDLFDRQIARQDSSFALEAATFRAIRPVFRLAGSGKPEEFLRRLSHARAAWDRAKAEPFP